MPHFMRQPTIIDSLNAGRPVPLIVPPPNRAGHYDLYPGNRDEAIEKVLEFEAIHAGKSSGVWRVMDDLYVALALAELSRSKPRDPSPVRGLYVAMQKGRNEHAVDRALRGVPPTSHPDAEETLGTVMDETLGPGFRGDLFGEMFVFGPKRLRYGAAREKLVEFAETHRIPRHYVGMLGGFAYLDTCLAKLQHVHAFANDLRHRPGLPIPAEGSSFIEKGSRRERLSIGSVFGNKFIAPALFSGLRMQVALDTYAEGLQLPAEARAHLMGALCIGAGYQATDRFDLPLPLRDLLLPLRHDNFRQSLQVGLHFVRALPARFSGPARVAAELHRMRGIEPVSPNLAISRHRRRDPAGSTAVDVLEVGAQDDMLERWSPWLWVGRDNSVHAIGPSLDAHGRFIVRPVRFSTAGNPFSAVTMDADPRKALHFYADEFASFCTRHDIQPVVPWGEDPDDRSHLNLVDAARLLQRFAANEAEIENHASEIGR
jgi:hypothetical protein